MVMVSRGLKPQASGRVGCRGGDPGDYVVGVCSVFKRQERLSLTVDEVRQQSAQIAERSCGEIAARCGRRKGGKQG